MKPRTHEENRVEVCILCLKKLNLQPLSTAMVDIIEQRVLADVRTLSWYYPTKICRACSFAIFSKEQKRFDNIPLHKYKFDARVVTRTTTTCSCEICIAARLTIVPKTKGKRGRPSTSGDAKQLKSLCSTCFTETAKGKRHKCSKTEAKRNLLDIIQSVPDTADPVVAAYMRNKPTDENGQVTLSNLRGRPSTWIPASSDLQGKRKPHLSVDDLYLIKKTCDLSTRRTLKLSSCLRGLDIEIAPNVAPEITVLNQTLQPFFETAQLPFSLNDDEEMVMKPVVYCNNVRGLAEHVRSKRGVDASSSFCKIGIDGGGGSLKVTLSIIEDSKQTSKTGSRGRCKDTGVKMLLILAVAPGVPEKYSNVAKIWNDLLHLNDFSCYVAGDLKIINLLSGIMGHSSSYPCPYCISPKSKLLNSNAPPRTLELVSSMSMKWKALGSQSKMAKDYLNCIEEPLICGKPSDTVLSLCPPPALHITLGIVNTIYKRVETIDAEKAEEWVKVSGCQRHSKFGFTGRNCHKLVKNRHVLSTEPLSLLRTALEQFADVFKSCFQESLTSNYIDKIENFSKTWTAANLPGTSKFHILKYHIQDFCEVTGTGLSKYGEQASETVHFDFNTTWNRVKVPETSDSYKEQLLRAVVLYNSGHL